MALVFFQELTVGTLTFVFYDLEVVQAAFWPVKIACKAVDELFFATDARLIVVGAH